jgi:hypothetical protein
MQGHFLIASKYQLQAQLSRLTNHKPTVPGYRPQITNHHSRITHMRNTLEISGILLAVLLATMAFHAWLTEHDDRLRLQATISTQKQALDAANLREHDRAATLKDTLAQIEALKQQTQTPAQILSSLPKFLSLPQPIALTPPQSAPRTTQKGTAQSEKSTCAAKKGCTFPPSVATSAAEGSSGLESPALSSQSNQQELPDAPTAQIPAADLKPLYDFVQDCRSCQGQLAAAKQDSTDNAAKLAAVTKERDAAIATAKGGSFWQRLRRNALWFVIGAGAGTAAVCATGHCR